MEPTFDRFYRFRLGCGLDFESALQTRKAVVALFAVVFVGAMTGCENGGTASNVSQGAPLPEPTPAPVADLCTSPTTTLISPGVRSTANTVAVRGAWSDVKIAPGSTRPATVYIDAGCACVRYTFWNGTGWTTEFVSAGNTTSFTSIRLAFLSTGTPIVVWSNSTTTLQIAIRNTADVTAQGSWSIANLDTAGTAVRAIELKVNPQDQVAILYARNTAGTAHLILCESGCGLTANYSAPSTTLGTVGTTPYSMGLGWCSTGSSYYPVVALTGAAATGIAICRQSTLSSCLSGIASWAGGTTYALTGTGASRATVQLAMDDSSVDAPVRAIAQNGSALAIYASSFAGGGCATGTVAAIAASGTISGTSANSGNAFLELVRDQTGNFHLLANETTTSVRYYNTTGGSFASWNAAGTVATATLAAAGSTRAGLAVDSTLGQAYATFSRTAAATPFPGNLSFAWIEDITVASNDPTAEYYETALTLDGQLQMTASQVPNVSVAATSGGRPAAAFVDYSANSATAGVLRYAIRPSSGSSWRTESISVVAQPQAVSLVFDRNDKPWIGFFDQQTLRFRLMTNSSSDGTGRWSTYVFPFRTTVTAATAPAYHSVAVAMDETASSVRPVLIVGIANHATLASTGIWSAKLNPETAEWSSPVQIDSTNAANSNSNVTADFDGSGHLVVAYYDRGAQNRVEYAQSADGGSTWSTPTRISLLTGAGQGVKVKLNPTNTRPAVSYYDKTNNRVYYSSCGTAFATCTDVVNWTSQVVENVSAGVSGLAATAEGLLTTALTFTNSGAAAITYSIGAGNSGSLVMKENSSGTFSPTPTNLNAGSNANIFSNSAISAINFAQGGWNVDSVRTAAGALHSVYVGPGNWLYGTSCGD